MSDMQNTIPENQLRNLAKKIPLLTLLYFHTKVFLESRKRYAEFKEEFREFKNLASKSTERLSLKWSERSPYLSDRTTTTSFDRHYIYHVAWAARILKQINPHVHTDISSSLSFCATVSAFLSIEFYDYRPVDIGLSQLSCHAGDLMDLPFADQSIHSLSCMHTIEHIGLGRYGDKLDPEGDLKAIEEIKRVLAPGGHFLFVIPMGEPKIIFNAHRIYSYEQIMEYFADYQLKEFSLIPDRTEDGGLIRHADKEMVKKQSYACGCFWFYKA